MTSDQIFDAIKVLQQIKMSVKFAEGKTDYARLSLVEEKLGQVADILQQMLSGTLTERERYNGLTGNTGRTA